MIARYEYVIVERGGYEYDNGCTNKREAVARAKEWDKDYPDDAPHRVVKRTDEQVWP